MVKSIFEFIFYILYEEKKKILIINVYIQWLCVFMCICSNEKNFICCKCIYSYGAFQISEGYKQKNCPKYFEICMDAF